MNRKTFEQDLEEREERIDELQTELREATSRKSLLEQRVNTLEQELANARQELADWQDRAGRAEESNNWLRSRTARLEDVNEHAIRYLQLASEQLPSGIVLDNIEGLLDEVNPGPLMGYARDYKNSRHEPRSKRVVRRVKGLSHRGIGTSPRDLHGPRSRRR